ncbi:ABC transporter permease [Paracoccus aestuariivivens]|uniref:ABC transporter permease subunit n=1 Tax=Paracoccus aestuariivivens TaxID=1820333 RepID=A0A6L6JDS1_9RHOB|nr:ABC transporter permease [Paracoccus aestuariivivens]MTH80252.1 ABC transporter permease subunit [Paracoccus aestuariivivens]
MQNSAGSPALSPQAVARQGGMAQLFKNRSLRGAVGLLSFFAIWQLLTSIGVIDAFLLPSPVAVAGAMWDMAVDGSLWIHLGASLRRVAIGFLLACIVGIALGLVSGWWRGVADFLRPVIEALRPIPPLAWIPITILWFGLGDSASYFLVFLGAVFPTYVATYTAVRGLDRNQMNAALCLGAKPWQLIWDVLVPASLPIVLPGMRIALGIGWMCVVTAELIAAQTGLGYLIQQSRMLFQINNVVAGMVTIGLVGFAMSAVLEMIERRVNAWAPSERS